MPSLTIAATQSDESRDGIALALAYLQAVMLFPSDQPKRQAYLETIAADAFLQAVDDGELDGESLPADLYKWASLTRRQGDFPTLFEQGTRPSAWTPRCAGDGASFHGGLIAAHVLLIPMWMHFHHSKSVGRRAAYRILVELIKKNRLYGVATERQVSEVWQRYQSVSHMWAAFRLLDTLPSNANELVGFLSLSEAVRRWAEQYRPLRSSEPLLDSCITWSVQAEFPLRDIDLEQEVAPLMATGDEWAKLVSAA